MAEDLLVTLVYEVGYAVKAPHNIQAVRDSNWEIVWRPATGTERFIHTWCHRCSTGVAIRPSGLLADRVAHRCPLLGGEKTEASIPSGRGSSSSDGGDIDWEVWVFGDEGGEEEGEVRKLRLPIWHVS